MRASLVNTSLRVLTWCCVILLAILSLLPAEEIVRTGLPGRLEHFVAYAGLAAIAMASYGGLICSNIATAGSARPPPTLAGPGRGRVPQGWWRPPRPCHGGVRHRHRARSGSRRRSPGSAAGLRIGAGLLFGRSPGPGTGASVVSPRELFEAAASDFFTIRYGHDGR